MTCDNCKVWIFEVCKSSCAVKCLFSFNNCFTSSAATVNGWCTNWCASWTMFALSNWLFDRCDVCWILWSGLNWIMLSSFFQLKYYFLADWGHNYNKQFVNWMTAKTKANNGFPDQYLTQLFGCFNHWLSVCEVSICTKVESRAQDKISKWNIWPHAVKVGNYSSPIIQIDVTVIVALLHKY